jgi:putative transposase
VAHANTTIIPHVNWLSNRVFKSRDDIVDHRCDAWNTLVDRRWKIMAIGLRQSGHELGAAR